ncbi:MAG TPA: response regulator [Nitrospirae bacterium]|nr:response regulator rcp1 [bacterium BMS3Abin10]GBE39612.1 response regulator rcp1 [bacterium BMS3Bbin08]HDK17675.1 response regulator [Nitrospirota bacterium]HDK81577.1 response regulator [Nitrospirota bacterium]HDO25116.1 response regulator [Nitrospirota bacterium]
MEESMRPFNILLVEDNAGDIRLVKEGLKEGKLYHNLHVVEDGEKAMEFLRQEAEFSGAPRPDIVLLDLNLPRKDGREVLAEIKNDMKLKNIPIIVLTTSDAEQDITKTYEHHANCYVTKPVDFEQFNRVITAIEKFWFTIAKLPGAR